MPLFDLASQSHDTTYHSDLLIVGAGVAGLTLASALQDTNLSIDIIEAGGLRTSEDSQSLFEAEMTKFRHHGATEGRFRVFGGSSTAWGGQLLPLSSNDFAERNYIPNSGWPISNDDLQPYLHEAENLLSVNHLPFDDAPPFSPKILIPAHLAHSLSIRYSKWAPFSHRNVAKTLGRSCIKNPSTRVFVNSPATSLILSEKGDKVIAAVVTLDTKQSILFKSRITVIASGTIETIRLLLASRNQHPGTMGNSSNLLGLGIHDHISFRSAQLFPTNRRAFLDLYSPSFYQNTRHTPKLETSPFWQAKYSAPNTMGHIVFQRQDNDTITALRQVLRLIQSGQSSKASHLLTVFSRALKDAPAATRLFYYRYFKRRLLEANSAKIFLHIDTEQPPNLQNKIQLSTRTDRLGQPLPRISWAWGNPELSAMSQYKALFTEFWNRSQYGPSIEWYPLPKLDTQHTSISDTFHLMGGTRMSSSPSQGVVDHNLLVHRTSNLYLASCSVFPTGGSSNPTLTLIMLTIRLSRLLRMRLAT
ncbi:GMC oxidoreductase [Synechococcus sp. W4D4]|uniref:GMC oxidoreductase n=1 Tax=Synechococcus sp. W4D4 TaxID=3392294 RepID=UPI0039E769D3